MPTLFVSCNRQAGVECRGRRLLVSQAQISDPLVNLPSAPVTGSAVGRPMFFSHGKLIHAVERDVEVRLGIVVCRAMPNFLDAIANKPRNMSKNRVSCDAARALRSKEQKAML